MIVVMHRIPVASDSAEAFAERSRDRASTIASGPGFLRTEILRPLQGAHYIIKTYWRTHEGFARWTRGESFPRAYAHRSPTAGGSDPYALEIYEVVQEHGVLLLPVRGVDWP
ncbi:MAG: antibiotic biosynthesis monooxygenase [Thermodesulfobacteriota bacterium]|jgi:heme-degrading monooxygenase HmoA